jgi:hypothetical protein
LAARVLYFFFLSCFAFPLLEVLGCWEVRLTVACLQLWDARAHHETMRWTHVHGRGRMFGERAADLAIRNSVLYSIGADGCIRALDLDPYV